MFQRPSAVVYVNVLGIALLGAASPIDVMMAECKKGSRDCFPQDRVGVVAEIATYGRSPSALLNLPSRLS